MELNDAQIERYSRHLILDDVGLEGQRRLLTGRVLLVGVGGLGSPAGLYLAAGGVGTLGLIDGDAVDRTNLQRQVAHFTPDIDRPKVDSAADKLRKLNPDVRVITYHERLTAANADDILADYDLVVDGTDNFAAKFLVADACHFASTPYVHAGILRWSGQLMTVLPGRTTCYRCVFDGPPPPDTVPSCSQAGVLGAVAGVVGTLQATEAVKYLLGKQGLLTDRLLTWDADGMRFRSVDLRRNPDCPLCGPNPRIRELRDEAPATCDLAGDRSA